MQTNPCISLISPGADRPFSSPKTPQNSVKNIRIRNGRGIRLGADLIFDGISPRDPGAPGPHQAHC